MKDSLSNLIRPLKNKFVFLAILATLLPLKTQARVYIQIDQASEKKFPIAVVPLSASGKGSSDFKNGITDIIEKDLRLSGVFDLIPEGQFPNSAREPGSGLSFQPWSLIGAQALIMGTYNGDSGKTRVELFLYDPVVGQQLLSRSYTTSENDMSVVANHFADEVMQILSGEEGVFSTKIAYTQVIKKGKKEIGVMDMNGENAKIITKDKNINLSPAWSPNGSQIAYSTFTKNGAVEINVIGSGGGGQKKVTNNGSINLSPAYHPNGSLTVASALRGDTDIFQINSSGDFLKNISNSFGIDVNPSWSPDGSRIVFASERAGKLHIFTADAGGGGVTRLTFVGSQNDNPSWSPKGDKIAFQSMAGGWDIFIVNTDGSNLQRLTSNGSSESPSWAPNGRFITYSQAGQVSIMREDGANPTAVGPKGTLQPAWGPKAK